MINWLYRGIQSSLVLLTSTLLFGCSSQPITIEHYLLNISEPSIVETPKSEANMTVIITDIVLPDYLNSRSLVMQQANGTLSVATKHVWAQPLDSDFGTLLASALSKNESITAYFASLGVRFIPNGNADRDAKLAVVIEHFMPLASGQVVLTGFTQLTIKNAEVLPQRFDFAVPLDKNGYVHSVAKMRALVQMLADNIALQLINSEATR